MNDDCLEFIMRTVKRIGALRDKIEYLIKFREVEGISH
jgi:hypothetical protein